MAKWKLALGDLRQLILTGKLRPGTIWNRSRLSEKLGIEYPRAALRGAVDQLVSDGVLERREKSGFYVRKIEKEELQACLQARLPLECLIATVLGRKIKADSTSGDELQRAYTAMEQLARTVDEDQGFLAFLDSDIEFHATIARLAGYPGLVGLLASVHNRILHAVHASLFERSAARGPIRQAAKAQSTRKRRVAQILEEHQQILKALQFGDAVHIRKAVEANVHGFAKIKDWNPFPSRKDLVRVRVP